MQSLKEDGIFTSGDEDSLRESLGDALFDPTLPIEGEEGDELGAPTVGDEEETPEEF